jgi:hypothetical protein
MSFGASAVVFHHSKAKESDLLVLYAIANFIGDDGAWPSVETIAHFARTSTRTVYRSIESLEQLGEIEKISKGGKGKGVYKTNRYLITLSCPLDCAGDWNHTPVADVRSRGDKVSGLEVTLVADKPVIEPVTKTNVIQSATEQRFLEFWDAYPHRKNDNKKRALAIFARLKANEQASALAGAIVFAQDPDLPTDRQFIPMAATWLHQERWNDIDEKSVTKKTEITNWGY